MEMTHTYEFAGTNLNMNSLQPDSGLRVTYSNDLAASLELSQDPTPSEHAPERKHR